MIFNALVKPKQYILIQELPKGRLIDIGGGGEGVISKAGGGEVIAIDKYMSEILEAREKTPEREWMVADGTEMPYTMACFDNATAFFSCMYMSDEVKGNVFKETHRVLKKGGEFWIWDVNMAAINKVFAIRLQVEAPRISTIKTIYGVKAKDQSVNSICGLLREVGFEAEIITNQKHWFLIKAKAVTL